jgi:hypothetical protein
MSISTKWHMWDDSKPSGMTLREELEEGMHDIEHSERRQHSHRHGLMTMLVIAKYGQQGPFLQAG